MIGTALESAFSTCGGSASTGSAPATRGDRIAHVIGGVVEIAIQLERDGDIGATVAARAFDAVDAFQPPRAGFQ
jgi:hypothetical protein